MAEIHEVALPGLTRPPDAPIRLWYAQPVLRPAPGGPPWSINHYGDATALQLLRSVIAIESGIADRAVPTFILLPEYSLRKEELAEAVALAASAPTNTAVVFGLAQLSPQEALALEDTPALWDTPDDATFTNCAVVCIAGSTQIRLQPKIVPSQWEPQRFWPGRVIRYFYADGISFIVQVCSDLLPQPGAKSNAADVRNWAERSNRRLHLVLWLQHNEKSRSQDFAESLMCYCGMQATVLAVASRGATRLPRLDNYAVSGAVTHQRALPRHFHLIAKEFHYVEPVTPEREISRLVLLRYDADAYRATTALADALILSSGVEKGHFFPDSRPYVYADGSLQPSLAHFHIEDLVRAATNLAAAEAGPWNGALLDVVASTILPLGAKEFLAFLDLALLPRAGHGIASHAAGEIHAGTDLVCRCWDHRVCVDLLTDQTRESTRALANVLLVLAALRHHAVEFRLLYLANHRTYLELTLDTSLRYLAVVFPFGLDAAEVESRLASPGRPPVLDAAYIILGTSGRSSPRVPILSIAQAPVSGAPDAANPSPPRLRTMYQDDLNAALTTNTVTERLRQLFAA